MESITVENAAYAIASIVAAAAIIAYVIGGWYLGAIISSRMSMGEGYKPDDVDYVAGGFGFLIFNLVFWGITSGIFNWLQGG